VPSSNPQVQLGSQMPHLHPGYRLHVQGMVLEELPKGNPPTGVLPAQTDHPGENTARERSQTSNLPLPSVPFQPPPLEEPCSAAAHQPRSPTHRPTFSSTAGFQTYASKGIRCPSAAMPSIAKSPCPDKLLLQLWGDPCCLYLLM